MRFTFGRRLVVLSVSACALVLLAAASASTAATRWRAIEAVLPANAFVNNNPEAFIPSVSCASAGNCSAVGTYRDDSGTAQGLLLTETRGKWGPGVESTLPANALDRSGSSVASVSCASAGNCSAVGEYDATGPAFAQAMLLAETDGTWATGVEAAPPANAATGPDREVSLSSVSCASAGNCSAVGTYLDNNSNFDGLLLSETGGTWATGVEAALPPNASSSETLLTAVSCASAGNCSAVGTYSDSSGGGGLLLRERDGTWMRGVEAPLPANAATNGGVDLASISCASAGSCSAVGSYGDGAGRTHGLLLSETAGRWTGVEAKLPANSVPSSSPGHQPELNSVSCGSAGNCAAVGDYVDRAGNKHALVLNETAGRWTSGAELAVPADIATKPVRRLALSSVSCASRGNCTTVGFYRVHIDRSYWVRGLIAIETAGRWGVGVEAPRPSNAYGNARLDSVSCPAAEKSCGAVGNYRGAMGLEGSLLDTACLVPTVKGKTLRVAKRSITSHGCSLGTITRATSRTVTRGTVIAQSPSPGRRLSPGAKVSLEVSKGR